MEEQNIKLNDDIKLTNCETPIEEPYAIERSPLKPIMLSNNSLTCRNIIIVIAGKINKSH